MTRIVATAEPYGFGPVAKLIGIVRAAPLAVPGRWEFVGHGSALTAARAAADRFGSVTELDTSDAAAVLEVLRGADLLVDVMEPTAVVCAAALGVPVGYVDSLPHVWRPELTVRRIAALADAVRGDERAALRVCAELAPHDLQAVAHALAERSYLQQGPNPPLSALTPRRPVPVGGIVSRVRPGADSPDVLVSLSGQRSALVPLEAAVRYAELAARLVRGCAGHLPPDGSIWLTGNPEVLDRLPAEALAALPGTVRVRPLGPDAMSAALAGAGVVLAPPGLTTYLECADQRVPLLLLPDQHAGHRINRRQIDPDDAFGPWNLDTPVPPAVPSFAEIITDTGELAAATGRVLGDAARVADAGELFGAAVAGLLRSPTARDALAERQCRQVAAAFGGTDGARAIVRDLARLLDPPPGARPDGPGTDRPRPDRLRPAVAGGTPVRAEPVVLRPKLKEAERRHVAAVLDSGELSAVGGGRFVRALEDAVRAVTGARHAVAVSSGTAALHIALRAAAEVAGAPLAAGVALPTHTFAASANAVLAAGGAPLPLDVDGRTLRPVDGALKQAGADGARVLLCVHMYGVPLPAAGLAAAVGPGTLLVEDCAQALGSWLDGRHVGLAGLAGTLSFSSEKAASSGEGGMVITDDESVADYARAFRDNGMTGWNQLRTPALNHRMTELQAAVALGQVERLPELQAARDAVAARYAERLAGTALEAVPPPAGARFSWAKYPVRVPDSWGVDADDVVAALRAENVPIQAGYRGMHGYRRLSRAGRPAHCPVADGWQPRTFHLPTGPAVSTALAGEVLAALEKITHWFDR
ncbi:DegT/DnrJ/EryC1/StrS family aminotransferase [Kitasatospora sp. NPDC048239]|uniref:DegT/DnrJ/EryC1/StrS family aminotransferase n=1 Tax=Kitasatospora sp. NPDC048239 TaxID=3364046 RepID=UPI00371E779F